MILIFEIIDKTKRKIRLTNKQWKHIASRHPEIQDRLESIKDTLTAPHKIVNYSDIVNGAAYYYRYFKDIKSRAKYLRIIVKYLNGKGFIISSHFIEKIE